MQFNRIRPIHILASGLILLSLILSIVAIQVAGTTSQQHAQFCNYVADSASVTVTELQYQNLGC